MKIKKTKLGLIIAAVLTSNAYASTFTVNTTTDAVDATPGDGICGDGNGQCTLRAAITEANLLAGEDEIVLPVDTLLIEL